MARYIHEHDAWPALRWNSDALSKHLATVLDRREQLLSRVDTLSLDQRNELALRTLTEEVLKSSEIEGELLDKERVRSSIAHRLGMDAGAVTPTDRNIEGVVEMMLDATQNYTAPLTTKRLFGWHASLFPTGWSGIEKIKVGAWRPPSSDPMQVISGYRGQRVHYEAPHASPTRCGSS